MLKTPQGNMNEMELKMGVLERDNFDLKMQLFHLNKKYTSLEEKYAAVQDAAADGGSDDKSSIEILMLREENELSMQRIMELEAEVYQLKLFRDDPKVAITQDGDDADPLSSVSGARDIIEDNRRRERETSIAIAEHDAALIEKLQNEVAFYQKQHAADTEVAESHEEKIKVDTELIAFKDEKIIELLKFINELKQAVDILRQKVNRNESGDNGMLALQSVSDLDVGDDVMQLLSEDDLRRECKALRTQLRRQQQAISNQEKALAQVKDIVEDISTYSSGEIKRLEAELDRCLEDRERLLRKCCNLEYALEQQQFAKGGLVPVSSSSAISAPSVDPVAAAGASGLAALNSQYSSPAQSSSPQRKIAAPAGGAPSLYIYDGSRVQEVDSVTADICSLDMYRQREAELLHSLQSVVARCEQLEHEREILYRN